MAEDSNFAADIDPSIPDRSFGDYFCKLCDSHMNSENMWEAHITGKRHQKNVEKGDADTKYEELSDEIPEVDHALRNVKEPVVGLSYIHQIRRREPNVPPIYSCYLCHATIATAPLLVEHILSFKHRFNYIKEVDPNQFELIKGTNLNNSVLEPIVSEACRKLEEKDGRGQMKVKQEKKKSPPAVTYSGKKGFKMDDDDDDRHWKKHKNSRDSDIPPWRSDKERNFEQRRRRSPDFDDRYRHRSRSRSPVEFRGRKDRYSEEEFSSRSDVFPKHDYKANGSKRHFLQSVIPEEDSRYDRHRPSSTRDVSPSYETYSHRYRDSENKAQHSAGESSKTELASMLKRQALETIMKVTEPLPPGDCFDILTDKLKSLPECRYMGEFLSLAQMVVQAYDKMRTMLESNQNYKGLMHSLMFTPHETRHYVNLIREEKAERERSSTFTPSANDFNRHPMNVPDNFRFPQNIPDPLQFPRQHQGNIHRQPSDHGIYYPHFPKNF